MTTTLKATFDGTVLRLDEPLSLPPNTRVRITVEPDSRAGESCSFLRTARSLELHGPPDWSERLEDYLYGEAPGDDGPRFVTADDARATGPLKRRKKIRSPENNSTNSTNSTPSSPRAVPGS